MQASTYLPPRSLQGHHHLQVVLTVPQLRGPLGVSLQDTGHPEGQQEAECRRRQDDVEPPRVALVDEVVGGGQGRGWDRCHLFSSRNKSRLSVQRYLFAWLFPGKLIALLRWFGGFYIYIWLGLWGKEQKKRKGRIAPISTWKGDTLKLRYIFYLHLSGNVPLPADPCTSRSKTATTTVVEAVIATAVESATTIAAGTRATATTTVYTVVAQQQDRIAATIGALVSSNSRGSRSTIEHWWFPK